MTNKYNCQNILTCYLARECSEEENKKVLDWLEAAPENKAEFKKLKFAWNKASELKLGYDQEKIWKALMTKISDQGHVTLIYSMKQKA